MYSKMLRLWSILLVIVLLINMLPAEAIAAELQTAQAETAQAQVAQQEEIPARQQIVDEVLSARTEYAKEFMLSSGMRLAVVYPEAVHYEKDGQWNEIDNTLTAELTDKGSIYRNTAGVWDVAFPQTMGQGSEIRITKDGYTLRFSLEGKLGAPTTGELAAAAIGTEAVQAARTATAQVQAVDLSKRKESTDYPETVPEKLYSRVHYSSIYDGTDMIYNLSGSQIKESLVMAKHDPALRGYRYTLHTGSLIPVLHESGRIDLYDEKQETVIMSMPEPFLVDAANEFNYDVSVSLQGSKGVYTLTYRLPQSWMGEEARRYPVILDPIITADLDVSNIKDATVYQYNPPMDYLGGVLECGHRSSYGIMRSFIKYQSLPELRSSDVVVSASLRLLNPNSSSFASPIEVHKVNGDWESETISWSNQPAYNSITEDYAVVQNPGYYYWNITNIVRGWYASGNTGLMLRAPDSIETDTSTTTYLKQFYSSDYSAYNDDTKPYLEIMFRNNNGLESYWDFTSASAGRAGSGYVNNYTGNLVWVHGDIGFGGNVMPVSISHVHNANDAAENAFGVGAGWRTNFHQRIYQWTKDTNYYVWEDADGTDHYFLRDSAGNYQDEDGLEMTITVQSGDSKYKLSDKYGNYSLFDTQGRLTRQYSNQANAPYIQVSYSGDQISQITDGAGRKYVFSYNSGLLSSISYQGKGSDDISTVSYGYSGSRLTTITSPDGKQTHYTYDDNQLLTSAQDIDGYKLAYTYTTRQQTHQPFRVASVEESDGAALGSKLTISYGNNQTTFTDHDGNKQVMQFNNWGNTVSVHDDEGHAQYAQYAFNNVGDNNNAPAADKANQLKLSSNMQNTVGNRLKHISFENNSDWGPKTGSITTACSQEDMYYGYYALKLTSTAAQQGAGTLTGYTVSAGQTVTFSAYVKSGSTGGYAAILQNGTVHKGETFAGNSTWQRIQVTYTNSSQQSQTVYCCVYLDNAGTAYVDCVQLENTATASRYNIIENGDFNAGEAYWNRSPLSSDCGILGTTDEVSPTLDPAVFLIYGKSEEYKQLIQYVQIQGSAGDTFVFGGWAQGDSVPIGDIQNRQRTFDIRLSFSNNDGSTTTETLHFNPNTNQWQFASGVAVAEKSYFGIVIIFDYNFNGNTVYVDGLQLYKESFGSSYTYDTDGNVVSVKDLHNKTTTYEYQNNNLTKQILPTGAAMTYTYDSAHNVTSATTAEGQVYSFTYDGYGNNTAVSITAGGVTMQSTAAYTADGNYLASATDTAGNTTTYSYNTNTGVLEWSKAPEDTDATRTNYTYDALYRLAQTSCTTDTGSQLSAAYTYTDDLLTAVETPSTTYTFAYGDFAQRSSIKVGTNTLATYSYTNDRNRYLSTMTYGNGDSISYTYDNKGRVTKQTYEDGESISYQYDNDGILARATESSTDSSVANFYDFSGRLGKYEYKRPDYSYTSQPGYDENNNVSTLTENINGTSQTTTYTYDDDNRLVSSDIDGESIVYTYDNFGRLTQQQTVLMGYEIITKSYTYIPGTSQVATYRTVTQYYDVTYTYTYDDNGNILSISDGTNTTSYAYDSANQLIREDNQAGGKTFTYGYDNAGNVEIAMEDDYTPASSAPTGMQGMEHFGYSNSQWGDQITNHNGYTYEYDAVGNLLFNYTWMYTWEHGRQLTSISDGLQLWTFGYDVNGLRTYKEWDAFKYYYLYDNAGKLAYLYFDKMFTGHDLYFSYDPVTGYPQTVNYDNEIFYYVTNLQGDVVAITRYNGEVVVEYTYDAWGKQLSCTGELSSSLGYDNPLRYRGYVYDEETSLYYLQSRYYDPNLGRFINADAYAATGQGFLGNNMYAYCLNNPVNMTDDVGFRPIVYTEKGKEEEKERLYSMQQMKKKNCIDLTSKLTLYMEQNALELEEYKRLHGKVRAIIYFYENVTDGGALDIKLQEEWKFAEGKVYIFNGESLRYDDPGNINFGYVGAVLFPEEILCFGAGANQVKKWGFVYGDWSTYFDDPRDNAMIRYGYKLYQEAKK